MTLDDMKKAGQADNTEQLNSLSTTSVSSTFSAIAEVKDDSNQQSSCNILNRSGPAQSVHLVGFLVLIIIWLNRVLNRNHFSTTLAFANNLFNVPPRIDLRSEDVINEQCDLKDSRD